MPHLQKIYDKYKAQNFAMVAINTQASQDDMIPEWRAKGKYTFSILVGATQESLTENYGVRGSPTSFLVNEEGKILFKHVGYSPGAEKTMEAEIREMLNLDPFEGITQKEETKSISSPNQ